MPSYSFTQLCCQLWTRLKSSDSFTDFSRNYVDVRNVSTIRLRCVHRAVSSLCDLIKMLIPVEFWMDKDNIFSANFEDTVHPLLAAHSRTRVLMSDTLNMPFRFTDQLVPSTLSRE